MSVLLTDILDYPTSNEVVTSRRLIDSIFSLLGSGDGVVAEQNGQRIDRHLPAAGKECWMMLWALRQRAWKAIGVDPAVIWKCESLHISPITLISLTCDQVLKNTITWMLIRATVQVSSLLISNVPRTYTFLFRLER